jgi:4-carboxymuconolactone decarboxylase
MPPDEAALVAYATEMFNVHRVSAETYQRAIDQFGPRWLTELSTMMGYYTLLAYNANSFEIDLPEDGPEPTLPV